MASEVPRFAPGVLDAGQLNALVDLANALAAMGVGGALERTAGGNLFAPPCREFAALKLTGGGTGGLYDWTLQRPIDVAPWWEDTTDTGDADDEPAAEINETSGIASGTYVWAWREPGVRGWQFMGDGCA